MKRAYIIRSKDGLKKKDGKLLKYLSEGASSKSIDNLFAISLINQWQPEYVGLKCNCVVGIWILSKDALNKKNFGIKYRNEIKNKHSTVPVRGPQ